jgi:transcriptional regulator with XRE-family HTH domain
MTVRGLGARLSALRSQADLSQEEMARRLEISRSAYQYYERSQRDLTGLLLLKIFQVFDVDPLWMLEGDTENGKSRRHDEVAPAYRKIGLAVEHRIRKRGLSVMTEKNGTLSIFCLQNFLTPTLWAAKITRQTPSESTAFWG